MKVQYIAFFVLLISCKQNSTKNKKTEGTPYMVFDGKKLVDKNRQDSVIYDLHKKVPISPNYRFDEKFDEYLRSITGMQI